jgi:hypothetical protein
MFTLLCYHIPLLLFCRPLPLALTNYLRLDKYSLQVIIWTNLLKASQNITIRTHKLILDVFCLVLFRRWCSTHESRAWMRLRYEGRQSETEDLGLHCMCGYHRKLERDKILAGTLARFSSKPYIYVLFKETKVHSQAKRHITRASFHAFLVVLSEQELAQNISITYLLTHGGEPFLRSRQLRSHSRTCQHFKEPEGSITCS